MDFVGDRFNRMTGKTQFVVCRIFVHLAGKEVAPLFGVLNGAARQATQAEGDIQTFGAGLTEICQSLLQYDLYWQSAANEGDRFWDEGEAGDYIEQLFTDSAQRYRSGTEMVEADENVLAIPVTQNLLVMLSVAYEGETPELEANLSDRDALKIALKALINLHYQDRLRAVQIHFSPAQLGDELTDDQLILHFPELAPL
ncbi:MAG: DUF1517 domain-containing protein [Acaryochloris sp. RU_4_1]|nr:DUF1517 domain-containing protein [Acaryochloris sp. RU_4_1]NJR56515.1 DUF1517 domain-containing protein [Acaryochloris sp. CRU_2_0]